MESSSALARRSQLLTHLTDEQERLGVVKAAAPGHRAGCGGPAGDIPEPRTRSRSLTRAGLWKSPKGPGVTEVGEMLRVPKGN